MNTRTTIGILAVFTMTLSMAVLLPARADIPPTPGTSLETQFVVSGPAADQIQYQIFGSETAEFGALSAQGIDLTDTPLNPVDVPTFCPTTATSWWCTGVSPNPADGEFGFQHDDINLANNFWGITFCFGQDGITTGGACQPRNGAVTVPGYAFTTASCANVPAPHTGDCTYAGIQWRQGFASLLDKGCVAGKPALCTSSHGLVHNVFGDAAQSIDNVGDVPAQAIQHSGYSWDPSCAASLAAGCVGSYTASSVSPQAGTTYSLGGVCSWDTVHRTAGFTNCVSANNFNGGTSTSSDGITWDVGSPNFCNAADHFIQAGIATSKAAGTCVLQGLLGPGGEVVFAIRNDSPNRLKSGTAEFKRFCSLLGLPVVGTSCSGLTNTGATLKLTDHELTITDAFTFVFSGSSTDGVTTNTPNLDWHLYTGANSGTPAFDQQWALYDSGLDSTICGGTSAVPASPTGDFPLPNDVYSCNVKMDHYMEMNQFNSSITNAAVSLQVAMDIFGNHTINNPTISRTQQFAFLKGWQGISDATGIGIATGNAFSLLNGWNANPAITGPTIRWGMKQGTSSLNPFTFTTVFEFNILQEIYDALLTFTPYIPGTGPQVIGFMANNYRLVSHTGAVGTKDANCPNGIVKNGFNFTVQGCYLLNLRGDIFWQDGVQVTASDVKFSYEGFNATGGIASPGTLNTVDVVYNSTVLPTSLGGLEAPGQPENLYIALASANAFATLDFTGVPIVPQHLWATIGASGACQDTPKKLDGSGKGTAQCTIDPSFLAGPGADPVLNNRLIGSSAFACASGPLGASGTVLGGGCTSTGSSSVTSGTITLFRYGHGVSHLAGSYFRSNAKFKEWEWAKTTVASTDPFSVSILDVSAIGACIPNPAGASCPHYRSPDAALVSGTLPCITTAGPCIGTVSGGTGGPTTGLQKAEVIQWFGSDWTSPFVYDNVATSHGTSLLDTVPTSTAAPQVLYEDGSQYT